MKVRPFGHPDGPAEQKLEVQWPRTLWFPGPVKMSLDAVDARQVEIVSNESGNRAVIIANHFHIAVRFIAGEGRRQGNSWSYRARR